MKPTDFWRYHDGFYWLTNKYGDNPCLVCLYTPRDPRLRGIGFGIWDGGLFVPIGEIEEGTTLIPLVDATVFPKVNFNRSKNE